MKFLYVGDLHQDEITPVNRIDDFNETRKEKINEIINIAKTNNVKAILHGGDFFNRPKMSNEFVTSIIESWSEQLIDIDILSLVQQYQSGTISLDEFNKQIDLNKNIPIISIIGNHDLIGDHLDSYPKTSLHVLEASGFITIVDKEKPIIFNENGISVGITGTHYNREWDKGNDKTGYCITKKVEFDNKEVDYQIHLTHGMLTPTSYGKKFAHTTITEIEPMTIADLTINGHDHIGFDTTTINGKLFANPGSPFRLSTDKKEINRMPKVLLIEINKNGIQLNDIYLKCAKKGDDVLSENAKLIAKNKQNALAKIQTMINQSSMKKGLLIADIIDNIGKADNIDPIILKDIQDKIVQSMNVLQPPFNPSGDYYITRVELKNFLSHKDSAFDFTEGLNILAGKSRSGKSAVLRALREVLTCSITQPRDAIFFGASYFSISVFTSNGYIVTRKVERDEKKGFNGYEIFDPNTGNITKYNTKSVGLVQEILGYNKIALTEKKSIDINSVIQGDNWFYIGSGMTAPDRARLLGVVYGTHYADAANKEIASSIKKTNTNLNLVQKEKERLEVQKQEYDYLPNLKSSLDNAESLMQQLEKDEKTLENAKNLYKTLVAIENEQKNLQIVLQSLQTNFTQDLNVLKEKEQTLNLIKKNYDAMTSIVKQGQEFRIVANSLKDISIIRNNFEDLKKSEKTLIEEKEKYQKFVELDTTKKKIEQEKNTLTNTSNSLIVLNDAKNQIKDLKKQELTLTKFKENANKSIELGNKQVNYQKQIEECKNILQSLKNLPNKNDIKQLKVQQENITKCKELLDNLNQIAKDGKEQRKELEETKKKVLSYIDEYKKELENLGECPICHSKIDSIIVNHLVKQHLDKVNN